MDWTLKSQNTSRSPQKKIPATSSPKSYVNADMKRPEQVFYNANRHANTLKKIEASENWLQYSRIKEGVASGSSDKLRRICALFIMDNESKPRVVTFDSDHQTIHEFLDHWKPSLVTSIDVEWLTVSSGHASKEDELVDTSGLEAAWEALCLSSLDQLTTRDIERLAIAHNVLHGKWMIFATRHEVDTMWATIALAVVKGDLALDAKVSTAHVKPKNNGKPKEEKIPPGKHVICVWSQNFSNIDDVFALRGRLQDLGFLHPLMYKPGAYSICGVYQGNRLGLPANKFKS